jgi:hypothetical protein
LRFEKQLAIKSAKIIIKRLMATGLQIDSAPDASSGKNGYFEASFSAIARNRLASPSLPWAVQIRLTFSK